MHIKSDIPKLVGPTDMSGKIRRSPINYLILSDRMSGCVLFGSIRAARLGAARKIKRVVILFVPGYTAGLARIDPVWPGHERPGHSGSLRANPAV